jgi:hypothetical protein
MKGLALCAAALLAACSDRTPPAKSPASETEAATPATPSSRSSQAAPVTLAGEWKVVGIDGNDLNEPYGIALSANASEIWWEPRCAGMVRGYSIKGTAIRFGSAPSLGPPPRPGTPPRPVCAIGLPPRLFDVVRVLDAATLVQRTPANGVGISGGGHSLLLFSQ